MTLAATYLQNVRGIFSQYRRNAETALGRVSDNDFFHVPGPDENSLAILVAHMAGNLISRWDGFPEADGEKASRQRDQEFLENQPSRAELMARWETGWHLLEKALDQTDAASFLMANHTIRGENHKVVEAINRQIAHYGYHIGQLIQLCRHYVGPTWTSLTIPKGQSNAFNQHMGHDPK